MKCELEKPTNKALMQMSNWLSACLKIGWQKSDLDFLESLWWQYHDFAGRLLDKKAGQP